ncbi:prolipoprotein diacylglyceryl transferase [Roseomonas sp. NAR14]|uniref:Phosphatidylglycerol--prolipoprotein diacylglyceryl transferase n=1 Tax=Roseomonas acroporae TaxID=2937791 RepID=A0A9X2BVT4_9PROT|nr:prolipoprotein diacylglyceryl transferase [Roseomonas acroporae]MCK8786973.1 prolipoprotein diacylglyceryl transferase [Roseomonas acroporae]
MPPLLTLPFPAFDPVLVQIGPFAIRWYALAYITGILLGWRLARRLVRLPPEAATTEQLDDFVTWATLGVVLGGRLGYVLFYRPGYYLFHPLEAFAVWQGGMSFHGGALGVIIAIFVFCWRNRIDPLRFGDRVTSVVPIGLGLGRLANFVNAELWGRPSDVPWAMVFPTDPLQVPRHPSQLYQFGLEGVALFVLLQILVRRPALRARRGFVAGAFLAGYGVARIIGEMFRQPDAHLGFLLGNAAVGVTMGQILSVPMVLVGAWMMLRTRRQAVPAPDAAGRSA